MKHNPVKTPQHYMLFDNLEAVDAIEILLSKEEFQGYLKGCELKYRLRAGLKGDAAQDTAKAMQYRLMREKPDSWKDVSGRVPVELAEYQSSIRDIQAIRVGGTAPEDELKEGGC